MYLESAHPAFLTTLVALVYSEVLGNLESTGMVPRLKKEKTKLGSVRNFMEPDDFSAILLRPSPLDFQVGNNVDTSDDLTDYSDDDNDDNDDIPVTEDSYQIEGKGDVEVRDAKRFFKDFEGRLLLLDP